MVPFLWYPSGASATSTARTTVSFSHRTTSYSIWLNGRQCLCWGCRLMRLVPHSTVLVWGFGFWVGLLVPTTMSYCKLTQTYWWCWVLHHGTKITKVEKAHREKSTWCCARNHLSIVVGRDGAVGFDTESWGLPIRHRAMWLCLCSLLVKSSNTMHKMGRSTLYSLQISLVKPLLLLFGIFYF